MSDIQYVTGDATQPKGRGQMFIVHVVNDIGAWGAGFVMAVSRRWPETRKVYQRHFREYSLGDVQYIPVDFNITLVNLFGQHGIRRKGYTKPIRYDAIRKGLSWLAANLKSADFPCSVHMPRIGCGLAGGKWKEIELIVKETLVAMGIPVFVYDLPLGGSRG